MYELMQKGGPMMWPILVASIITLTIIIERTIFFRRQDLRAADFLLGIVNLVRRKHLAEALDRCDEAHGPVAQVVHAAIRNHKLPKPELKELVQDVAQLQVPRLEQHLTLLATVGYISPLLGLLGTVTGMISTFSALQQRAGMATAGDLAGGIWEALLTTAAGLCVAIPTYAAHNYFQVRAQRIVRDMERAGIEIIQAINEQGQIIAFDPKAQGTDPFADLRRREEGEQNKPSA